MSKVENFSPYLLALAKRAMVERVKITTTSYATAKRLQARFNKLRVAMRKEEHPELAFIERVSTRSSKRDDSEHWVVFEPADFDLEQLIQGAGIDPIKYE